LVPAPVEGFAGGSNPLRESRQKNTDAILWQQLNEYNGYAGPDATMTIDIGRSPLPRSPPQLARVLKLAQEIA